MGDVFYFLLNMSIVASVAGLAVMLLRRIKRLPRRIAALLWVIPFIRAVVPVAINSRYSLMSLLSGISVRAVPLLEGADDLSFSALNCIVAANSYFPIRYKIDLLSRVFRTASLVWLIVAAGILIALGILYFITLRELRGAKKTGKGLYVSDKVQSPAVYGILRPKIVFPSGGVIDPYALRHEQAHVRRLDNLWRLMAFVTAALHWFNPLFLLMLKLFLSDLELACDESAVRGLSKEERKSYALALLESSRSKDLFASAFGGAKVRTRIDRILAYNGITWFSAAAFLLLAAAVAFILITNPR